MKGTQYSHFGIGANFLDIHAMRYRMFGAVWKVEKGFRYIMGYWFADSEKIITEIVHSEGWTNLQKVSGQISDIYQAVRAE
ncbi:hypothetical protein [Peribacillus simplex]|uniref:hypothetical protein n=1 Tax=Peribacillus simplex TaxID=1478 RepID=UPI00366B4B00